MTLRKIETEPPTSLKKEVVRNSEEKSRMQIENIVSDTIRA